MIRVFWHILARWHEVRADAALNRFDMLGFDRHREKMARCAGRVRKNLSGGDA